MRTSRLLLTVACLICLSAPDLACASTESQAEVETNWTFTYLKAVAGQKESLRAFIEENWFVLDQLAVDRGLFKSYRLIENISSESSVDVMDWDFIVAVEYFGDQTYLNIRQQFEEIRSEHKTVLIDGKALKELGAIVRSERVLFH